MCSSSLQSWRAGRERLGGQDFDRRGGFRMDQRRCADGGVLKIAALGIDHRLDGTQMGKPVEQSRRFRNSPLLK